MLKLILQLAFIFDNYAGVNECIIYQSPLI